ncbi:LPXTG cell wall anchor domain-containing protein [Bacillus sp. FJAT-27251]|uniref:LPXTG cell wall anchor domain-containing protein n=1 Tax=Bacillus sp. FJAT-27251 TaxID=1684142 RepID=UPI0006A75C91|nr:LPXTG cell wall anchor domain-containing protein [Bacillus sp. FJAT-27251]
MRINSLRRKNPLKKITIIVSIILLSMLINTIAAFANDLQQDLLLLVTPGEKHDLFDNDMKLAPSRTTGERTVTIKNHYTGTIKLKPIFHFTLENIDDSQMDRMLSYYQIKAKLFHSGNELQSEDLFNGQWHSLTNFTELFNNNILMEKLGRGENYQLNFTLRLIEEAGNEFQGVKLNGEFIAKASGDSSTMIKDETGKILPNTGTNMYNLILIGSVLIISGTLLFILLKRRNAVNKRSKENPLCT